MQRITEWELPEGSQFQNQHGLTNYREWCDKECARINSHGGSVEVRQNKTGTKIAIFRKAGE